MELRDIEIYLTLAEELHFGRTAERLHVTQPRVSHVVKKMERRIGGVLFERSSRHVALTPLGARLRDDLAAVRTDLQASLDRASRTARGSTEVLRLGMVSWNTDELRPVFQAFGHQHPGRELQIRSLSFADPFGPLRAGTVDVALLWLPVREPDLTVGPTVFTEPVVLALSATHPLAEKDSVSYEDLANEVMIGGVTPDYWREAIVPARTPSGRPLAVGPTVTNFEQMLPILATGEAISPVHAHGIRYARRDDISYVPIQDAPIARWALIWCTADDNHLVQALAKTVLEHGPLSL
ncbi:LysR family transcriptional regulator [Amycolatopsis sp. NPDC051071]|uniref:LysR family transcriptional regulator n=1 Tax=Amycolatopsis sp. NPDC051071 TaxID=3154637 RepID=UPI00341581C7